MANISPSVNFPNILHSDRWQLNFSNIPSLETIRDMRIYDSMVKSVTFPDYNMGEIISDMPSGFKIRHPIGPWPNADLSQIQVEFKLSEDMKNYGNLFHWIQSMKYGKVNDFDKEDFFRKYTIKSINLTILDNQKRPVVVWRFTNAFLLSLSSISFNMGISDEIVFTCNFSYEEVFYKTKDTTGVCEY